MDLRSFKINTIKPSMTHEDKVYEYARRISHYSLEASYERKMSKIFGCESLDENFEACGERCGCLKRERIENSKLHKIGDSLVSDFIDGGSFCSGCKEARRHYNLYRDAVSKKAAALRQINREMTKNN